VQVAVQVAFKPEIGGLTFPVRTVRDGVVESAMVSLGRPMAVNHAEHVVNRGDVLLPVVVDTELAQIPTFFHGPANDNPLAKLELGFSFVVGAGRSQIIENLLNRLLQVHIHVGS